MGTVAGQVLSRQLDDFSSEEPWWKEVEAPFSILENPSHREEPAPMSSSQEPAKDRKSEGHVYTRLGKKGKPVRKDGMYYHLFLFNMLLGCQYNQFYIVIVMFYVMLLSWHGIKSQILTL